MNLNKDIWLDCAVIYDGVWPSIMDNAREVYDTDGLSSDEYTVALKQVYDMYYDAPLVNIEYAEASTLGCTPDAVSCAASKAYPSTGYLLANPLLPVSWYRRL